MKKVHSALPRAAPVAVTAVYGAWWIAAHAGGGRASAHTLWQSLALAETLLALLLRDRKPATALVGILAAYLLLAPDPLLLPGVLVALCTVAATGRRTTMALAATATVAAITAMPYLHGDPVSLPGYLLPRLAAATIAAAAGALPGQRWWRRGDSNSWGVAPNTLSNNVGQRSPASATGRHLPEHDQGGRR